MRRERFVLAVDSGFARRQAEAAFATLAGELRAFLPVESEIHHIGATSIPGCATKGDLDLNVRLPSDRFGEAERALEARFHRNIDSIRTKDFASFKDDDRAPPLGIQLTAFGSEYDIFLDFRRLLASDAKLVTSYNALKQQHNGGDMARYRKAKGAFIRNLLGRQRDGNVAE